jgi:hypothetical protein
MRLRSSRAQHLAQFVRAATDLYLAQDLVS